MLAGNEPYWEAVNDLELFRQDGFSAGGPVDVENIRGLASARGLDFNYLLDAWIACERERHHFLNEKRRREEADEAHRKSKRKGESNDERSRPEQ